MNYIGRKFKLSSWIKDEIKQIVGNDLSQKVFCDIFAGTGIVGRTFKKDVKKVIANDLEHYSYVLNRNYIQNHKEIKNKEIYIDKLNNLPLIDNGFIYQNYCMGSGSDRQYFSDENGKKIDTIRTKIKEWYDKNEIDDDLYYFLLASLIESADKVANTASVYGAFLKHIKKSASKELILEPACFIENDNFHQVFNEDSNELIKKISGDILYLDPPYNQRQYSANYHLLNTISKYEPFTPKGKTGLPAYNRSSYCKKSEVKRSFKELIKNADFKYIFLSYNNEGLMSKEDVKSIMQKYGKYDLKIKEYQRFKADKTVNRIHKADSTFEHLHILEKYYSPNK
jgi:adenine-specific DNA-methyltransferase